MLVVVVAGDDGAGHIRSGLKNMKMLRMMLAEG